MSDTIDPATTDAYSLSKDVFDQEYAKLGKPDTAPTVEDPPRDADGRFTTEELGDARKIKDEDWPKAWASLGQPPAGDGHPISFNHNRIAEIRERRANGFGIPKNPQERETA